MIMGVHFISYGDSRFTASIKRILAEARNMGAFDSCVAVTRDDLDKGFLDSHAVVLAHKKGGGYYLWKPYVILTRLEQANDNDIVFWVDAGCTFNKNGIERFSQYIDIINKTEGILSFLTRKIPPRRNSKYGRYVEIEWSKRDLIDFLGAREFELTTQICTGVCAFRKTAFVVRLVRAWYETCVIDDYQYLYKPSATRNHEDFREHRWEQSIFSLLLKKHNVTPLEDEIFTFHYDLELAKRLPIWATRKRG